MMIRSKKAVPRRCARNDGEPGVHESGAQVAREITEPEYLSFENVLKVIWRQRRAVLLSLVAGLTTAGVLYKLQPKMYQARATIEIQLPNEDYLNHRQFDPSQGPGAVRI